MSIEDIDDKQDLYLFAGKVEINDAFQFAHKYTNNF